MFRTRKGMMMLLLSVAMVLSFESVYAQKKKGKKSSSPTVQTKKPNGKKKSYSSYITKSAVSDEGLFKTHKVDGKYYYEVPDSLLQKDMLLVSRISAIPAGLGGGFFNAGTKTNEQVVAWYKKDKKILLKIRSFNAVAADSLPIYKSVASNNYEPILYAFDVLAPNPDSTASLIEVTKFFSSDIKAISGLNSGLRRSYRVKRLDSKRSFIESIKSFPINIEVKQDFTFDADQPPSNGRSATISLQMNQSMILLPEEPMKPRKFDPRVGWFTISQIDYGSEELKADQKTYIRRWRLEPKDPDAYFRGELVEPVKPIVYYLDPATPEKLRKYIKQGVEDWQKAFETAGFKNAIIAKDPPTKEEDPEFSPEDARYSVVRYVASTTRNAVGPSVSDPRSGEIIESDIIWYHNHLRSYRNRYLLETGAANPSARTLNTPDEEIGEMMRMVIAHEVGHALGFPHNMRASFAYPVDSLRSGSFTQEYGIAASIMDYARYNYIAQPGDENIRFIRQLGPYDHYAVNWGYRALSTTTDENETLNKWILDKYDDPRYWFGNQGNNFDPASQTECIGDDPIKASTYGIENLKKVAPKLKEWTADVTNEYGDLGELYGELLGVWSRYVGHVVKNVGGIYEITKMANQDGFVYEPTNKATQKSSMRWLQKNAFQTQNWLMRPEILRNTAHTGYSERMRSLQRRHLNNILSFETLGRLIDAESIYGSTGYSAIEMMDDMRLGIWSEVRSRRKIDLVRRNLQRAYLERMEYLMTKEQTPIPARFRSFVKRISIDVSQSDIRPIVRGQLKRLRRDVASAKTQISDRATRYHLDDIQERIDLILDPK